MQYLQIKKIILCVIILLLLYSYTTIAGKTKTWIKSTKTVQDLLKESYRIVHIDYIHVLHEKREIIYFVDEKYTANRNLYKCILYEKFSGTSEEYTIQCCYEISK